MARMNEDGIAKIKELIKDQILDFNWSNYGLDQLQDLDSEDWAEGLADRIATQVVVPACDRVLEERETTPIHPSVGKIQSFCGASASPHEGHVWHTNRYRWCPGSETA